MVNATNSVVGREKPLTVVIIDGSLAGLIHGIMIKRLGHNVRILDKNMSSHRSDQAAGMGTGPQGSEFFRQADRCSEPYSFARPGFQFLDKNSNVKRFLDLPLNLTSWTVLYYRLRANFDSFQSESYPEPPALAVEDGNAVYDVGKCATDVLYRDGLVTVELEDLIQGGHQTIHADLVIVANGSFSNIRQRLLPGIQDTYSGYVAWRGTVPEREVSEETKKLFEKRFTVFPMKRGHALGYIIPGPKGTLTLGGRQLNWIWYCNLPAKSPDFKEDMTDIDGHLHHSTLPPGKMRPERWRRLTAQANEHLNAPFRELVSKTKNPFISTVRDCAAPQAAFFDGKVLLVGEALTLLRPHTGMSFNHSAVSCLLLQKVLMGEMSMEQWEREVLEYRQTTMLLSIAVGCYFQFGTLSPSFLLGVVKWVIVIFWQRLVRFWRSVRVGTR